MFEQEKKVNGTVDINEITRHVSKAVKEYLTQSGIPEENIDMNVIVEVLVQIVAGYVSYVKFETKHDIEEKIQNILTLMVKRFDGSYEEIRKISGQGEK
jgi:F0F1-type ATP synthase membrane subunit a